MPTDYALERRFFDRVAAQTEPTPMAAATLERCAHPRWPNLFGKEMMFALAGPLAGKSVLEVGCGEGIASVQLAYCGAAVTGLDISEVSVRAARRRPRSTAWTRGSRSPTSLRPRRSAAANTTWSGAT